MKTRLLISALVVAVGAFTACTSQNADAPRAGTVTLSDGTRLAGSVSENSSNEIVIAGVDGSSHTVPKVQVRAIEYVDAAPVPVPTDVAASPVLPASAPTSSPTPAPRRAPVAARPARPIVERYHPTPEAITTKTYMVPLDTELSVRVNDTIDSDTAVEGQTYSAELTNDVLDEDGNVVIPDGSNGQIVIKSATKGSRIRGASDLVLDLQSVTVGGRRYLVDTVDVQKKGRDTVGVNKRTAIFTGIGAAVGAVVGAVTGGGKGAGIGAASGAGAGAIAQVITSGNSIKVPVETVLTFRLDKPLKVVAK